MQDNIEQSAQQAVQKQDTSSGVFYHHLHAFRGITILLIIAAHTWALPIYFYSPQGVPDDLRWLMSICESFFHGTTILFTIISGLLFSLVLQKRGWRAFYRSKLLYVVVPYIVMTFIYTFLKWKVSGAGFFTITPDTWLGMINAAIANIPLGLAEFHMWYMPVLCLLFLLTPLLNYIVLQRVYWLLFFITVAPLFFSREWPFFSINTVIYFTGVYTVALYFGSKYQTFLATVQRYRILLAAIFIGITLSLIACYVFDYKKIGATSIVESMFYVQKIILSCLLIAWLYKNAQRLPKWLDVLGNYAFPLYFIHTFFTVAIVNWLKANELLSGNPWYVLVLGAVLLIGITLLTLGISVVLKKILKSSSRMIIGA